MDLSLIKDFLDANQQPAFRYRQIVKNYYSGRYSNFSQMTDLSVVLWVALVVPPVTWVLNVT